MANISKINTTKISREQENGITQELVIKLFYYKNGKLFWNIKPNDPISIGTEAGGLVGKRIRIKINRFTYSRTRLIFLYHKGYLPEIVDHENRICLDDRIENLREATYQQNTWNRSKSLGKTSKYTGVNFFSPKNKFRSVIYIDNKAKFIGYFDDEKIAALEYNKYAVKHRGEFANLNIIQL